MINALRLIFVFLLIAATPLAARAQTAIAVVDVQMILAQSKAGISIEKQITAYKSKFLEEVSKKEQALRESEKALSAQRSSLSKEEFALKARALEKEFIETGSLTQSRKRALDTLSAKALETLRNKLSEIVQQLATEKNFNLVISKQNVIVGEQSIDLTEETMNRLNKELPDVPLELKTENKKE